MKTKKELNRIAAGFYLSEELPENWEELDIDQQHQFINENAWEPFEGMPASEIEEEMTSLWHALYKIEGDAYGEGHAEGYKEAMLDIEEDLREQPGGREPASIYEKLSTAYCEAIKK